MASEELHPLHRISAMENYPVRIESCRTKSCPDDFDKPSAN